jgi:hypothetical protein
MVPLIPVQAMFCTVWNPSLCIQLHSQQPDQQKWLFIIVKLFHAACTKFAPPLAALTSPSLHKMYPSYQTMLCLHIIHTILWFGVCCCPQVGLFIGYTAICFVLLWLAGSCNIRTASWWWRRCLGVETSCSYNKWISVNRYCVHSLVKHNRILQDCSYTLVWWWLVHLYTHTHTHTSAAQDGCALSKIIVKVKFTL